MNVPAITVRLTRGFSDKRVTLGLMQIEGIDHDPFFTLENPQRQTSTDSLIPAGSYTVRSYSSARHPVAWELQNVPGRSNILIHNGNMESQTLGCILIGLAAGTLQGPRVNQSIEAVRLLRQLLSDNDFTLVIT